MADTTYTVQEMDEHGNWVDVKASIMVSKKNAENLARTFYLNGAPATRVIASRIVTVYGDES